MKKKKKEIEKERKRERKQASKPSYNNGYHIMVMNETTIYKDASSLQIKQ